MTHVPSEQDRQRQGGPIAGIVPSGPVSTALRKHAASFDESLDSFDGPEPGAKQRPLSLAAIPRFKWTILTVFVLLAGPAIAAIWTLTHAKYEARAEVRVRPIIPYLVFRTEDSGMIPLYQSFLNTQVSIMRSPTVLQRALDQSEVQQTTWYKEPPPFSLMDRLLGALSVKSHQDSSHDQMERLREILSVRPRGRTELIDVAMTARKRSDAETIVNAILDQYVKYIREETDRTKDLLYRKLAEEHNSLRNEIGGRRRIAAGLKKQLGTGDPDELVSTKRVRLDEAVARGAMIEQETAVAEWQRKQITEPILDRLDQYIKLVQRMSGETRYFLVRKLTEKLSALSNEDENKALSEMSYETRDFLCRELTEELTALRGEAERRQEKKEPGAGNSEERDSQKAGQPPEAKNDLEQLRERIKIVERLQKQLAGLARKDTKATTQPATRTSDSPLYETDQEWVSLRNEVRSARRQLDLERVHRRKTHPVFIKLAKQIELAENQLRAREAELDERWRARPGLPQPTDMGQSNIVNELDALCRRIKLLKYQKQVLDDDIKKEGANLGRTFESAELLTKENEAIRHKRELYTAVRTRLDQKEMERNVPGSIEVSMRAFAPSKPHRDRRILLTAMAVAFGLGAGVALAFWRAGASQAIHEPSDILPAVRAPFLGQLPLVPTTRRARPVDSPVLKECIRMVRTAMLERVNGQPGSAVLITSAGPGAGKTTVTVMLAKSLAQCGKKILVVDADLRHPTIAEHFKIDPEPGFAGLLAGQTTDAEAIIDSDISRLSVLPAGGTAIAIDPELIANGAAAACLARWRRDYDIILLDSPPVLPVADARILSQQTDGTLMVVRENNCRRTDVLDALARLGASGGKLLGTIFLGSIRRRAYGPAYYNYTKG